MTLRKVNVLHHGETFTVDVPSDTIAEAIDKAIGEAITYHFVGAGRVRAVCEGVEYRANVRREVRYHVEHIEATKRRATP